MVVRAVIAVIAVTAIQAIFAPGLVAQRPVWLFLSSDPKLIIHDIERTGAKVRYTSRWLNAVSVDAGATSLARLKKHRAVISIQPVGVLHKASLDRNDRYDRNDRNDRPLNSADFDSAFYGPNFRAIRQLGIPGAHALGFTGRNIRIAILDTGFEPGHEALGTGRVLAQRDFIGGDATVSNEAGDANVGTPLDQEIHGTRVWSILGGHMPGRVVGPAFEADFLLAKVDLNEGSDQDVAADEDRWIAAVEWADSMGARIISSSLVYRDFIDKADYPPGVLSGDSARVTRMADEAARRGILVINAMGNFGPSPLSLWAPADADSIIAVGAVGALGEPLSISGRGPTADGRLKPELVALGEGLTGASSLTPNGYDNNLAGTSYTTPLIAGGAAMFMQAWPGLTIMAVRTALMLSGTRSENPDNNVGFGVPNIASAILFPEGLLPVGITGVNLQNELTTIQPTFTWSAPLVNQRLLPVTYNLQIATDPQFTNIIYNDTTQNSSLTIRRPLRPAPALFWRVVAEAFPDIRRTTRQTLPFSVPDWVRLLNLNRPTGNFTDSLRPTFRWESLAAPAPSGPLLYDVQVLVAQTGVPVFDATNLTTTSVQPPNPLTPNIAFRWRVIARSPLGPADTVLSNIFVITSETNPPATLLYQNFPNPFPRTDLGEPNTRIWFDVNARSAVELAIFDLRGRLIRQLIPAQSSCGTVTLEPGVYGRAADTDPCVSTQWDGRDARGGAVPRGVYILRMRADGTDQIKKILYLP
ncbi:MAG: S8 family serine peptidase [Gemmatimonadota bacterium]